MITKGQQRKLDYQNFYTARVLRTRIGMNEKLAHFDTGYNTILYKSPTTGRYYDVLRGKIKGVDGPDAKGLIFDRMVAPGTLKKIENKDEFDKALGLFGRLTFTIPKEGHGRKK